MSRALFVVCGLLPGIAVGWFLALSLSVRPEEPSEVIRRERREYAISTNNARCRESDYDIMLRANAFSAVKLLESSYEKVPNRGYVIWMSIAEDGTIILPSVQVRGQPTDIVFLFSGANGILVHYEYSIAAWKYDGIDATMWLGRSLVTERTDFQRVGTERDGIVWVSSSDFEDKQKRLRAPTGEFVVGFKYQDGTYSNFAPALWLNAVSQPDDPIVGGSETTRR